MKLLNLTSGVSVVRGDRSLNYQMADGGSVESREHIYQALKRGRSGYDFWVATNNSGDVVGALSGYVSRPFRQNEDVFYVSDLGSLHGGGVGSALMNAAIAHAFSSSLEVWLAYRSNSRGFYEKLGMKEVDGMMIASPV